MHNEVWELCWTHVNMEDHLFVEIQTSSKEIRFVCRELGLASSVENFLHLSTGKLLVHHIEVPVRLR